MYNKSPVNDSRIKIAIFSRGLLLNGATKSLIELLKNIDYSAWAVDLYLLDQSDMVAWAEEIPKDVHIKSIYRYDFSGRAMRNIIQHPFHFINSIFAGIKLRICPRWVDQIRYTADRLPVLDEQYDLAISYRERDVDVYYVLKNMKAAKKAFWIHAVEELKPFEIRKLKKVYTKYDYIFPVSNSAMEHMCEYIPEIREKCHIAHNIVDRQEILRLAQLGKKFDKVSGKTYILTVGRLSPEKGMALIAAACKILKEDKRSFEWHVLGDGPERAAIEQKIRDYGIENELRLHGMESNPYGYFSSCDIYVQTSYLEAYGLTINEAKIFHKPIVCTDIAAAREQISDQETGILVPHNAEKIAKAVIRYMEDREFNKHVSNQLCREDMEHFEAIDVLNTILKS